MRIFFALAACWALSAGTIEADIVTNFDSENGGNAALRFNGFADFDAAGAEFVDDLINNATSSGVNGTGLFVDLNGGVGNNPGSLTSKTTVGPGTYLLSFDLWNLNGREGTVALGPGFTQELFQTNAGTDFVNVEALIELTSAEKLVFRSTAVGPSGPIIDNVSLRQVPEADLYVIIARLRHARYRSPKTLLI